jgi:esterase/lipase
MVKGLLLAAILLAVFVVLAPPMVIPKIPPLPPRPPTYEEAAGMIGELLQNDRPDVQAVCRHRALLHGRKTPRVYVLMHGLANCPRQFLEIGETLHAQGSNVLVPRLPYHGLENRMTAEYKRLNLERLAGWTGHVLEIAHGLGGEVVVVGLSVNGTTAAWIAQERADIERVVIVAPFLAPAGTPAWLDPLLANVMYRLPNRFVWWDRQKRENLPGPKHAYPRFPTRVVGSFMQLGQVVIRLAAEAPPKCKSIAFLLSEADEGISLPVALKLAGRWEQWPGIHVETKIFPADLAVPHDMIDVFQPNARTEVVYPALLELLK